MIRHHLFYRRYILFVILFNLHKRFYTTGHGWDGYDHESGSYVEIDKGQLVRRGREIEFNDYGKGEYRYGDIESIHRYGSTIEIEVYDHESGEHRTFEMDSD